MGFSTRLCEALESCGWSLTDLSKEAGVDLSMLSRYKSGKVVPGTGHVVAIASALDVTVDWILGLDAPKRPWSRDDADFLERFKALPEDRREVVMKIMNW